MRLLFLAHRVPYPPNKGEKIRAFHEIRQFAKTHEVHLLAFYDRQEDAGHGAALRQYCRDVMLLPLHRPMQLLRAGVSLLRGRPWTLAYFHDPNMRRAVEEKLQSGRFDAVFVYSSSMAPYVAHARRIPKILDFVDSDAAKWEQYASRRRVPISWLYRAEFKRLSEFEQSMAECFDASAFVAAREARHLDRIGNDKVHFIQNGIDLHYFKPGTERPDGPNVVFTGAMDYYPNVDAVVFFAREILPLIRASCPGVRFTIVGSSPAAAVRKLERLPGVQVTGTVSDIRPYLATAAVAVVPLRISQGIQNKVLEALAMGVPVVASSNAAGGIQGIDNLPVRVADEPRLFAEQVLGCLDRPLTMEMVEECRDYLRRYYSWDSNLSAFEELLENVKGSRLAND